MQGVTYGVDMSKEELQQLAQQFAHLPSLSQSRQMEEDAALARLAQERLTLAERMQISADERTARELDEAEERALQQSIRAANMSAAKDARVGLAASLKGTLSRATGQIMMSGSTSPCTSRVSSFARCRLTYLAPLLLSFCCG